MMNLEDLRRHIQRAEKREWNGQTVWLRKIGATDGAAFFAEITELKSRELSAVQDNEATLSFYARAIAKSLCDEQGALAMDSEEGIALLKLVNFAELVELGEMVLRHSGFAVNEAKKNLAKPNETHSACAETLDSPTPITSSPG